jgi:flagellar basal-body rod protein FlgF
MFKGLSIAASGMLAEMDKQTLIANNLANVDTTGYKKDVVASQSFPSLLMYMVEGGSGSGYELENRQPIGLLGTGVEVAEATIDLGQGPLKQTENELDFALMGDGFFVLSTPGGERYTRNGSFTLDAQGQLVSQQGYPVLGQGGAIRIGGGEVQVDGSGNILVDGQRVNAFKLVAFAQPEDLQKVGQNLFAASGAGSAAIDVQVKQGYLESSNVNAVQEMVEMIAALRAYEANQRIVRSEDQMLDKAVNEVGRLR